MKSRILMALAAIMMPTLMFAVQKKTPLYICGFASSFNDSTVYFTEIQQLDDAYTDGKTGFLYSRDNYSYQLRETLKKMGLAHPTCITIFAKKRKDLDKKYASLKKRYTTKGHYNVKYLSASDFAFSPIIPDESEMKESPKPKTEKVKKDKKAHEAKKPQLPYEKK